MAQTEAPLSPSDSAPDPAGKGVSRTEMGVGGQGLQHQVTLPSMDRTRHGGRGVGGQLAAPSPPGAHHGPLQQPWTQVPDSTHHG